MLSTLGDGVNGAFAAAVLAAFGAAGCAPARAVRGVAAPRAAALAAGAV